MIRHMAAFFLLATFCFAALPAQAADKLTVMLDWFVNPDHATLMIAQEKGFFAQAGLEVEMIAPADPNDPPKMVRQVRLIWPYPINHSCMFKLTRVCPCAELRLQFPRR